MKKFASFLGICIGIVSIVLSIITFNMYEGSVQIKDVYGGDAYTGIQQAAAQSANNIRLAAKILRFGLGSVLLIIGLALIVYFAMKIGEDVNTGLSNSGNGGFGSVSPAAAVPVYSQSVPDPSPAAPVITKKPVDDWVCPKCGNRNSKIVTKCVKCDTEKPETPVGNIVTNSFRRDTETPKRPANDWICPKCGNKNSRLVTKCMNCDTLRVN